MTISTAATARVSSPLILQMVSKVADRATIADIEEFMFAFSSQYAAAYW
jgi:hypothetical protein